MTDIITSTDLPDDVASNAMVDMWVAGANAKAVRVAPCLGSATPGPTEDQLAEAKLILVGAVIRWSQAGAGAVQQQVAGPFSQTLDTRQRGGYNLWPSEISQLQDICKTSGQQAYGIDTVQASGGHSPICSIYFGGGACSCGAWIAGQPIYETDVP